MVITEISAQKSKGRYNLYVDDVFYSGLGAETIVKNGLKVGLEISKIDLDRIVLESEERSAFEKLIDIISRQLYTKFELKQKLLKHGYNQQAIDNAIKKAEEYGYVNDTNFAKAVIESRKNKSKMEIKAFLLKKGVKNNTINEELSVISDQQEKENAITLAEKYMKHKEVSQKTLASLYGYLSRKGFSSEIVSGVLRKYKSDDF